MDKPEQRAADHFAWRKKEVVRKDSLCGVDCTQCGLKDTCAGCVPTGGRPFGGECPLAACCRDTGCGRCESCPVSPCRLQEELIAEFRALGIPELSELTALTALKGAFVNLEYTLPSGQTAKFLKDDNLYLGSQLRKTGTDRWYGLAGDTDCLLVGEYGDGGADAQLLVYKKREK